MLTATSVTDAAAMLFGGGVTIAEKRSVYGGDINRSYRLTLSNGARVFLKCNRPENRPFFVSEAAGLDALGKSRTIGVPEPLAIGTDMEQGESFLLLEYLEPAQRVRGYWEVFGRQLAALHRAPCPPLTGGPFGFPEDNYIGATPQKNTPAASWVTFFRNQRLMPQILLARDKLDLDTRMRLERLAEHLDDVLPEPAFPSLLHGDLWSGNTVCGPDGKAWILDPAAYVGHFEAELAMTELFGGFPESFYRAYHEGNPIDCGYSERRDLYNLYHLLNHLNLFGEMYLFSVRQVVLLYT